MNAWTCNISCQRSGNEQSIVELVTDQSNWIYLDSDYLRGRTVSNKSDVQVELYASVNKKSKVSIDFNFAA